MEPADSIKLGTHRNAKESAMQNVRKIWILLTLLLLYCLLLWPFFVTGRTPFLTIGEHVVTWEAASGQQSV